MVDAIDSRLQEAWPEPVRRDLTQRRELAREIVEKGKDPDTTGLSLYVLAKMFIQLGKREEIWAKLEQHYILYENVVKINIFKNTNSIIFLRINLTGFKIIFKIQILLSNAQWREKEL